MNLFKLCALSLRLFTRVLWLSILAFKVNLLSPVTTNERDSYKDLLRGVKYILRLQKLCLIHSDLYSALMYTDVAGKEIYG